MNDSPNPSPAAARTESWGALLDDLARFVQLTAAERTEFLARWKRLPAPSPAETIDAVRAIHRAFAHLPYVFDEQTDRWEPVFQPLFPSLLRRAAAGQVDPLLDDAAADLGVLYRNLGKEQPQRRRLLQILAAVGGEKAIAALVVLLIDEPPTDPKAVESIFALLWRQTALPPAWLFPQLLEAIRHPQLAALILEYASELFRKGRVPTHPAAPRRQQLATLLEELFPELLRIARRPNDYAKDPQELTRVVERSVHLAGAIIDTLGLIGDPASRDVLRLGFETPHRKLQAEAASALARLKDDEGITKLAELAADPGSRVRALAYLEELGRLDAVEPEHCSPDAVAEGEAAACLNRPTQFGLAPSKMNLWDRRKLFWPGFDKPVECRLFEYAYVLPGGTVTGVVLTGPMTHSLPLDFRGLTPVEVLALYCGRLTDHDEIRRVVPENWTDRERIEFDAVAAAIAEEGWSGLRPIERISFFGEIVWNLIGDRDGTVAALLWENDVLTPHPLRRVPRSLQAVDHASLLIGLRILRQFNPGKV